MHPTKKETRYMATINFAKQTKKVFSKNVNFLFRLLKGGEHDYIPFTQCAVEGTAHTKKDEIMKIIIFKMLEVLKLNEHNRKVWRERYS